MANSYRVLRGETEHEKINNELLKKIVPVDVLQSYYLFGYAEALASIDYIINQANLKDDTTRKFFDEFIKAVNNQNPEIKSHYDRIKR